jgi:integrase
MATGITITHHRSCPSRTGCNCGKPCVPTYQAWVWLKRDGRKKKQTFPTLAAAKAWRADAVSQANRGTLRVATTVTLREAAAQWLEAAEDGTIRNRSGDVYKPSAIRGYRAALENRVLPDIGAHKLADIRLVDLQDMVDRMVRGGLDASTIRNQMMPLRVIYRRALSRGDVAVNPTAGLSLPAVRGRRDRIASPAEAAQLLAAIPDDRDRALWATALYAGLRRGELQALRWEDVDLGTNVIHVERSWDDTAHLVIEPKSRSGRRTVPIASVLRTALLEHHLRAGRPDQGLVFGSRNGTPFDARRLGERAQKAWGEASLDPIVLHEARHTFASLMIAAGVNAKALSTYMGHASITITLDRYSHLMPGNEEEAAGLLDEYLAKSAGPPSGLHSVQAASLSERS